MQVVRMAAVNPTGPDTLITIKVALDGVNRRFKLPLRDLGANVLPQKVRTDPTNLRTRKAATGLQDAARLVLVVSKKCHHDP